MSVPVAVVINDNQPDNQAIVEILCNPPTLGVGTKLYAPAEPDLVLQGGAWMFTRAATDNAEPNQEGEGLYRASVERLRVEFPDEHEAASLEEALRFCERWMPDAMPANERGQISFGRCMLEMALDAIRSHLAKAEAA